MGKFPYCDKNSVKKRSWTPEEDIALAAYIQQHGLGNWRSVPANTGLLRCSKSCRLRWTNYLRPGIKRGNFTEDEDRMIIHLQALLGNKWSAIVSYLPQRTNNDVKNYWNNQLKKKLGKNSLENGSKKSASSSSKGQWEKKLQTDVNMARQALCKALSLDKLSSDPNNNLFFPSTEVPLVETTIIPPQQIPPAVHITAAYAAVPPVTAPSVPIQTTPYVSSMENITRLLKNWGNKNAPTSFQTNASTQIRSNSFNSCTFSSVSNSDVSFYGKGYNFGNFVSENCTVQVQGQDQASEKNKTFNESEMPLRLLEKWLLEDSGGQGQNVDFMDVLNDGTADLF